MLRILKGRRLQYTASISVATCTVCTVMITVWSAPILPQLTSEDSPIGETLPPEDIGWITFTALLGSVFGNMIMGWLMNTFGRRGALLIMSVPMLVGWTMVLFARSLAVLYAARTILGLVLLAAPLTGIVYISEIAETCIRGRLTFINIIMAEIGALLSILIGPISYKLLAVVSLIVPIIFLGTFSFMPESPYYLIIKKREEEAEKVLIMLRNSSDVSEEFSQIKKDIEEHQSTTSAVSEIFRCKGYRKGFFIIIGLKTLVELSGTIAVTSYMTMIFKAAEIGISADLASAICFVVPFPFMFVSSYLIDKYGRKPLMYVSTLGSAMSFLLIAIFFFLKYFTQVDTSSLGLLPISGVFLQYIFKSVGLLTIPSLLQGELLPSNIKGEVIAIASVYGSILGCLVALGFPRASLVFGVHIVFIFFAVCCILGCLFVMFFVPETKGKSLAEIHNSLK